MPVGLRQAARGPRGLELTLAPSLQKFCTVAAPNKCLAQSNKSRKGCTSTKKRHQHRRLKQSRTKFMNEPIDLLRYHFGLTPAEARLALHLVAGDALRSAAAKLSITYETARTELKNIFNKTGTCRQAELVIVLVTALSPGVTKMTTSVPQVPRPRWVKAKKAILYVLTIVYVILTDFFSSIVFSS